MRPIHVHLKCTYTFFLTPTVRFLILVRLCLTRTMGRPRSGLQAGSIPVVSFGCRWEVNNRHGVFQLNSRRVRQPVPLLVRGVTGVLLHTPFITPIEFQTRGLVVPYNPWSVRWYHWPAGATIRRFGVDWIVRFQVSHQTNQYSTRS